DKGFGFLEVDGQKSYFIPPPQMKKVMHGDRVIAAVHTNGDKEFQAEITDYITDKDDHFAPWWVTLMRHQLERDAPEMGNEALTL
ncbi:exoribonuclease II, partial [Proteus terrae]